MLNWNKFILNPYLYSLYVRKYMEVTKRSLLGPCIKKVALVRVPWVAANERQASTFQHQWGSTYIVNENLLRKLGPCTRRLTLPSSATEESSSFRMLLWSMPSFLDLALSEKKLPFLDFSFDGWMHDLDTNVRPTQELILRRRHHPWSWTRLFPTWTIKVTKRS